MKILLGQNFLIMLSVIILYYLLNNSTFLPYTESGSIEWQNVIVLIFFTSIILINLLSIIFVLINKIFLRRPFTKRLFYKSTKLGIFFTIGVVLIFVLNFLHILNIYYGLAILAIVIILLFVI
jgi:hypothetical protein